MPRVAIIGAGPVGLTLLRVLQQTQGIIPEIVCYEKQEEWGGMWNFTWRTGTDQYGDTIHNSMYRHLWANIPKEYSEFPDYSYEKHFGKPIPSFPPRAVIREYILGYARKSDIRKYIKFNSKVESVVYEGDKFRLIIWNKIEDTRSFEEFDYVVVASGRFSVPYIPEYEGMDSFPGRILHSHDFRDAEQFRGHDVIILGNKSSAEDISLLCYKHGAKSVTIGYRHTPLGYKWPDNVKEVRHLDRLVGRTAYFKDGHVLEADTIILCTGYLYHFPFMQESIRLKTDLRLKTDQHCPPNLYKGVVWHNNRKLLYLGMLKRFFSFPGLEAQTWLTRDIIMGKVVLPSSDDIEKDIYYWREKVKQTQSSSDLTKFQRDYMKSICSLVGYEKYDIDSYCSRFIAKMKFKGENILTYRDHPFEASGPVSRLKWLETMDDSLETYIANC